MKKLMSIGLASVLFGVGLAGCAQGGMGMRDGMGMKHGMAMKDGMKMDMKMMDMNNDGMISKEEFMKHHESMYDSMKKDSNGMVSVQNMQMMMNDMMKMNK